VVLTVHDWGGLLGLTLPMKTPERYSGRFIMNTAFATGDAPLPQGFLDWGAYNNKQPALAVGALLARACPRLTPAEAAAYDAPFPDAAFKGGVRRFPNLVPDHPDAAVGIKDPVLGPPVMRAVARTIRNCPPPYEVAEGGHFLQEWGVEVAGAALEVL